MSRKPQIPLLVKDVQRMRAALNISALNRVRVIIQAGEQNLGVGFECYICEELLEWAHESGWWICPVCGDQTTEQEARGLLVICSEGLKRILGEAEEDEKQDTSSKGGRWVDRLRSLMGS